MALRQGVRVWGNKGAVIRSPRALRMPADALFKAPLKPRAVCSPAADVLDAQLQLY